MLLNARSQCSTSEDRRHLDLFPGFFIHAAGQLLESDVWLRLWVITGIETSNSEAI